jgi:N-acetylglutamate synthase/N-acetylornithine aminotransferase
MIEEKIQIVPGFSWFGKNLGIKDKTLDFGGILSDIQCQAAGVFTKSSIPGAPVIIGKEHIRNGLLQAVIVNSKNANVATLQRGIDDSRKICELVAESCGINIVKDISEILKKNEVHIEIVLGDGLYSEKVWGCDLTEEYVGKNAYYTT